LRALATPAIVTTTTIGDALCRCLAIFYFEEIILFYLTSHCLYGIVVCKVKLPHSMYEGPMKPVSFRFGSLRQVERAINLAYESGINAFKVGNRVYFAAKLVAVEPIIQASLAA